MPKRKRGNGGISQDDPEALLAAKTHAVEKKLFHGKTVLGRAMKNAKTLLSLKLQRNLKASGVDNNKEKAKLTTELRVLKDLDIKFTIDTHLHKLLLKSKILIGSGLLPEDVREPIKKCTEDDNDTVTRANITSRLWATAAVKQATTGIIDSLYKTAELENPASQQKLPGKTVGAAQDTTSVEAGEQLEDESVTIEGDEMAETRTIGEPTWEGFDEESSYPLDDDEEQENLGQYDTRISNSSDEDDDDSEESGEDDTEIIDEIENENEYYSRYDGLIGNSSDEESLADSDSDDGIRRPSAKPKTIPERDVSLSPSSSSSPLPNNPKAVKPVKIKKEAKSVRTPTSSSTFLPTLLGGYWSGSESATDDSDFDAAPPPRKNRMGQQARRALAEKKFGSGAKHLKEGKDAAIRRQDDWDPRRGARPSGDRERGRRRGGLGFRGRFGRDMSTGENASPIVPRARGMGRKDDSGVLHPSWEAKKVAKASQTAAKFEGKKVVFD